MKWYRTRSGWEGSRTIRDLMAPRWAQYFMSSAQFHATVHCLLTSNRLSVQTAALTVVQTSAFGMTLRRKGFVSQREGVVLYAMVLVLGMLVIFEDLRKRSMFHLAIFLGNVTAALRMYWEMNKYIMWGGVVMVLSYLVQRGMLHDDTFPLEAKWISILSWMILLWGCPLKNFTP